MHSTNNCNSHGNIAGSTWSSGLKKQQQQQQKPKVPKRGPGVAELEKILRGQECIDTTDKGNSQRIDANQYDSSANNPRNLSNESNLIWPYSETVQERNNQCLPAKQFLETSTSSGSLPIRIPNRLELPSNQNSYHNCSSRVPMEHKMVGMKRSHSSTLENTLIPPSNFHVLPSFSHYNRPHQSSINDSHGVSSFNSTKECYRDAKWGRTLELSNIRYNSDIAAPGHANIPPFATPEIPSPPMHLHLFPGVLSKENVFPCQLTEDKMDSYQHSESSGQEHRSFYNFLEVEDSEGATDGASGGREAGRVDIDLNLKL